MIDNTCQLNDHAVYQLDQGPELQCLLKVKQDLS